jgi:hypothetical protein
MNSAGTNHEREILRCMHDGIQTKLMPEDKKELRDWRRMNKKLGRGSGIEYAYDERYSNCDVAVMVGSWKPERSNVHHIVRSSIVEKAKCFICIETPLLGRRVFQPNVHQRIGINGFLNRDAIWGEEQIYPSDRLSQLGINYEGWKRNQGDKIVVALQLAGDASMRNNDVNQWCIDTVNTLREYTDRPIEIRTHPGAGDKAWEKGDYNKIMQYFMFTGVKNISFINGRTVPWEDQIKNAYCVVAYTSGLTIDAVVNGIPVIACDEGNFAWNIGERKLRNIENLQLANDSDVHQWLRNLAYCQWTPEEMESGECWEHLASSVEKVLQDHESNQLS